MDKNKSTAEMIQSMKSMSTEERMAFLRQQRPEMFQVSAPVISFGKAPKGGWTDADRVK